MWRRADEPGALWYLTSWPVRLRKFVAVSFAMRDVVICTPYSVLCTLSTAVRYGQGCFTRRLSAHVISL